MCSSCLRLLWEGLLPLAGSVSCYGNHSLEDVPELVNALLYLYFNRLLAEC